MKAPSGFYWKRKKREAFPLTKLYPFENIVHNFSKWELAQERIILDSKYSYDTFNSLMNKLLEIQDNKIDNYLIEKCTNCARNGRKN